jgi:hypothetical protein
MRLSLLCILLMLSAWAFGQAAPPTDNPVAKYGYAWTDGLKWANVAAVVTAPGEPADEMLAAAQTDLAAKGGGVIYFSAGTYTFREDIKLKSGILLRGAPGRATKDARDGEFAPGTTFLFPKYAFTAAGEGTPNSTAFKAIRLEDEVEGHDCGVVNIEIEHGHIELGTGKDFAATIAAGKGAKRLIVYGCTVRNAARPDTAVPAAFQQKWQRWTQRHGAAIHIFTGGEVLVMNNRIPASGEDNFVMKGYTLYKATKEGVGIKALTAADLRETDVTFNYDNRPGIYVNTGGAGTNLDIWNAYLGKPAPPEPGAQALVKGIVVRNNYIWNDGCTAINVTGDGAYIGHNTIRFRPNVVLPTARGLQYDAFTNNNRAIELRGYRWTADGNDYEVYSNIVTDEAFNEPGVATGGRRYGDGEGIMHEAYNNCGIRDGKIINNRGNRYICLWRVPVDGLEIRGNYVPHIDVNCRTNPATGHVALPCKNVRVTDNITYAVGDWYHAQMRFSAGLIVTGGTGENILVKGNRQVEPGGVLCRQVADGITLEGNEGYVLEERKP